MVGCWLWLLCASCRGTRLFVCSFCLYLSVAADTGTQFLSCSLSDETLKKKRRLEEVTLKLSRLRHFLKGVHSRKGTTQTYIPCLSCVSTQSYTHFLLTGLFLSVSLLFDVTPQLFCHPRVLHVCFFNLALARSFYQLFCPSFAFVKLRIMPTVAASRSDALAPVRRCETRQL